MESRIGKLEREIEIMRKESYMKVADYAAQKIGQNLELFSPKFQGLFDDFSMFRVSTEKEFEDIHRSIRNEHLLQQQIDTMRREIDLVKRIQGQQGLTGLEEIQTSVVLMQHEFENIKLKFKNLATSEKIDQFEIKLREFITIEQFREFNSDLRQYYVTKDQLELLQIETKQINQKFENYLSIEQYIQRLEEHDKEIDQRLLTRLSITDFNESLKSLDDSIDERFSQFEKTFETFRKNFGKIFKDFTEVRDDIKYLDEQLLTKVDTEEGQNIWNNFEKYALYQDLKDLYQKTLPEISKFEQKIIDFTGQLEKMHIIVRRFDELITEKASKLDIKEVYQNLQNYTTNKEFLDNKTNLLDKIKENLTKITQIEEMIDILGKNISKDIYSAVRRATQHLSKHADGGLNDQVLQNEEIKNLLAYKADRQELMDINNLKSNKVDVEIALRWIEVVHKQLKQSVVLIIEMLNFELQKNQIKANDGEHSLKNNKLFLFQQALLISRWMSKFDPKNMNQYYENDNNFVPIDVKAFEKFTEESLKNLENISLSPNNHLLNQSIKIKTSKGLRQSGIPVSKTPSVSVGKSPNMKRVMNQTQSIINQREIIDSPFSHFESFDKEYHMRTFIESNKHILKKNLKNSNNYVSNEGGGSKIKNRITMHFPQTAINSTRSISAVAMQSQNKFTTERLQEEGETLTESQQIELKSPSVFKNVNFPGIYSKI